MLAMPLSTDAVLPLSLIGRGELGRHGRADSAQRRRLERDLAAAAASGGFVLHYQPRVALQNGRHAGAEAGISWLRRRHGLVSAAAFLPLAEGAGLTAEIGGWMLKAACLEAASWPSGTVSLSVSPQQLGGHALAQQLGDALELSALPPERVELAFAEPTLMEVDADTLLLLSSIRDLGCGLAVDDFGASIGSTAMLRRLPLTGLKLTRALVRSVARDGEAAAFARAMIDAGHALGLALTADGIETDAQRSFLARAGCEHGQGILFGQRLNASALRAAM